MALPLYALTLFISAFILFLVQPIVGKIILPKLGGTPQVWNTCMVFFQMVLLAGYAYTHNATTRLTLRQQLVAHLVLLALPLALLLPFPFALGGQYLEKETGTITYASNASPIVITSANHKMTTGMRATVTGVNGNAAANGNWVVTAIDSTKFQLDSSKGNGEYSSGGEYVGGNVNPRSLWGFVPDLGSNPIPSTLLILFAFVALPFLVVATTAPLLQRWFVHTGHPAAKDPYFLYGASNLGSMLSLILYPIIIEPNLKLQEQGWTYTIGYLCLAAFVLACAAMVWHSKEVVHHKPKHEPAPSAAHTTPPASPEPAPSTTAPTGVKQGSPPMKPKGAPGRPHVGAETSIAIASDDVTFTRRLRWVLLAAVPSSLMLGITTHITTDLSPMPLFWLVPLILYLGSFILVFMRWPIVWTERAHPFFLYAQPFCIALMIIVDVMNLTSDTRFLVFAIFAHVLGFFATTMVCHGELAKDRPGTKHLTEFYLWMSVGGMLGGIFNGLVAPVIFPKLWEFPLAIFAAGLVRPKMFETGLFDNFLAALFEGAPETAPKPGAKGAKHAPSISTGVSANDSLVRTLDIAWPVAILILTGVLGLFIGSSSNVGRLVAYGAPLLLCCMCLARPIRFGLGVGIVLLLQLIFAAQNDPYSIFTTRSYFGAMSVKEYPVERKVGGGVKEMFRYRQLIHGHIDHGMNYLPPKSSERGNPNKDLSRLATTYYHREGPEGRVMEKFNWFPGPANSNTYWADARMPANLVTAAWADFAAGSILPMTTLAAAWSEPPFATVGLGTGTMASYGRPYQHVHFYEIDNQVLRLSLAMPTRKIRDFKQYQKERDTRRETYFNYLEQAIERGSTVQVLMGDARLRMALPYKNHYEDPEGLDNGGGPKNFYHMMVVDAFSSDAIPAHLLTMEAFQMYFDRLTPEGILCVHTSNRFVDLPKVVAAVSSKLGYAHLRGHDSATDREEGHYTSEWVMVAREAEHLKHLSKDKDFLKRYDDLTKNKPGRPSDEDFWQSVNVNLRYVWTDDYYNLLSVVRFRARQDD